MPCAGGRTSQVLPDVWGRRRGSSGYGDADQAPGRAQVPVTHSDNAVERDRALGERLAPGQGWRARQRRVATATTENDARLYRKGDRQETQLAFLSDARTPSFIDRRRELRARVLVEPPGLRSARRPRQRILASQEHQLCIRRAVVTANCSGAFDANCDDRRRTGVRCLPGRFRTRGRLRRRG